MNSSYPQHLARTVLLKDGVEIVIRPIRAEDAHIEQRFVKQLSEESRFFRFMHALKELTPSMLERFTRIDYDREMAFIATWMEEGEELEIGVARHVYEVEETSCEFAVVVADEWQGRGVASALMNALMEEARARGLCEMTGEVLSYNRNMLDLVTRFGFEITRHPEDTTLRLVRREL